VLIGRASELAAVVRALAGPGLVLLTGSVGIGKTALAVTAVRQTGRTALIGGGLRALSNVPGVAVGRAVAGRLPGHDPVLATEIMRLRVGAGVLVLDDAQWADRLSLTVARRLAQHARVLICVRTLTPPACRLAARIRADARLTIALTGLPDADALLLVQVCASLRVPARVGPPAQVGPSASASASGAEPDAGEVVRRAGGNPLALRELAVADGTGTLRQTVAAGLSELSQPARTAIAALGALGQGLPVAVVGAAATELQNAGLVRLSAGPAPMVTAIEPAIAELAFGLLPPAERVALQGRLAQLLPPGQAARLLAAAGLTQAAITAARAGAEQAAEEAERVQLTVLALRLAGADAPPRERLDLAAKAMALQDWPSALELLDPDRPLPAGDELERLVLRAELALMMQDRATAADRTAQAVGLTGSAGPAGEPDRFVGQHPAHRFANRLALLQAELELPRDPAAAARTAAGLLVILPDGDVSELADRARARTLLGLALARSGGLRWEDELRRAALDAERSGAWAVRCRAVLAHARALLQAGRVAAAQELAAGFAAVCRERGALTWTLRCEAVLLWAQLHLHGELDAVTEAGSSVLAGAAPADVVQQVSALVALALGDAGHPRAGRRILDAHAPANRIGRWTAAELALLAGDYGFAELSGSELASRPDLAGRLGVLTAAFAAYVAQAVDVPEIAVPQGSDPWRTGMRREQVRVLWAAGAAALPSDRAHGLQLLQQAYDCAGRDGLEALQSLISASLRRAGAAPPARRGRGDGEPTARERQVLDLVADGLSSRAIAGQLGLSVLTVDSHVRSAMTTLGAPTRLAAAVRAREFG
jgi:DNA-binding CsgD family transcriptional regulator